MATKDDYVNSAAITVHGPESDQVHEATLMQLQHLMLESDGEDGEDYVNQVSANVRMGQLLVWVGEWIRAKLNTY